jgi:hypothetical protein
MRPWCNSPYSAKASSLRRYDHTQIHHTLGKTPLDE